MNNTFTIKNFNINLFNSLLNQSLIVNSQLMLEFDKDMLKSCSFSMTKSLIKLWTIPKSKLIFQKQDENVLEALDSHTKEETPNIPSFNFYILKGDLFRNYLAVFINNESVDITFNLIDTEDGKKQATSMIIVGKSETGAPLSTEFLLTTEELISNKISDYSDILRECTPSANDDEFHLTNKQIGEIRGLVKKLHKSMVGNTSYINFVIDKNHVSVNDKVFNIKFDETFPKVTEPINFKILKSDFSLIGDHSFKIFTKNNSEKVIFGSKFGDSIIWILTTKTSEVSLSVENDDSEDVLNSLELDLSEYGM